MGSRCTAITTTHHSPDAPPRHLRLGDDENLNGLEGSHDLAQFFDSKTQPSGRIRRGFTFVKRVDL